MSAADGTVTKRLEFEFGVYEGEVSEASGRRHGQGKLTYISGNAYEGGWREGAADGEGLKSFANGDLYFGEWAAGKRHGHGKYHYAQGHVYEGAYAGDQCHGQGVLQTASGDVYDGAWVAGRKHGEGTEVLQDGQTFLGVWVRGKKNGEGRMTTGAGARVHGVWANDACSEVIERVDPEGADGAVAEAAPARPEINQGPMFDAATVESMEALGLGPGAVEAMGSFNTNVERTMGAVAGGINAMDTQLQALTDALALIEDAAELEAGSSGGDDDAGSDDAQ
jgi:hypothetical protein